MADNQGVVALETTLICHGLPRGENLDAANEIESEVRQHGSVPATIGVLDGIVRIGLTSAELERLATSNDVVKCSTRDLARVIAAKDCGATTIASTIYLARKANLRVMATGGLGGVHLGGEASLDISADIGELSRSPMAVFCSGPKAILDVPRTMEALESAGVAVLGYGSKKLAGFYVAEMDIVVPSVADVRAVVDLLQASDSLGWPGSLVFCQPPPPELAFEAHVFSRLLQAALDEVAREGVSGAAVTPRLLSHIAQETGGRSVMLNRALVLRNAALAAKAAHAYAR